MDHADRLLQGDPLVQLIQKDNFIGWVYAIDYDTAHVMTNDLWKAQTLGIPHNCFLVATTFDPDHYSQTTYEEQEVVLLRVVGASKLPQDDDMVRTKIDHFQEATAIETDEERDYDDITRNQLQFGGLACRVLGTFFIRDHALCLGSDLESFAVAARLNVYRPRGNALEIIANYVDPIRKSAARAQAEELGIKMPEPFKIGTVRYTSTDRLHRSIATENVPVTVQPSDFLARRTAVLGMTRTGKSNMVKQMVSVVKRVADENEVAIGQIIYDINGEYANANQQDKGAIADLYPDQTVRYRMLETSGFRDLRTNFYEQVQEGYVLIQRELREAGRDSSSDYVKAFVNMSLDKPDQNEIEQFYRYERRAAAYKALLYKAGFEVPGGHVVKFRANQQVKDAVNQAAGKRLKDPVSGLTLPELVEWFEAAREANQTNPLPSSTPGRLWVDDTLQNLFDMLVQRGARNMFISGYRILADIVKYHTPARSQDVAEEIYALLKAGKIVILDLSVGDPTLRDKIGKQIASKIFNGSMGVFVQGRIPPNIVIYIEEAHNLIGKEMDLSETWPRIAKEGAKYRVALVYATQEVSSVHPNILANTENWFITHLNNEREIKELARFYDFEDFSRSLIRAQDVGFARVKTLSSPFVIPVQIDKFDPQEELRRLGRG